MDEQTWLASTDPQQMLAALRDPTSLALGHAYWTGKPMASERKLRLWACACARQIWHLLENEQSRQAVEVSERYADGEGADGDLQHADSEATQAAEGYLDHTLPCAAAWVAACIPEIPCGIGMVLHNLRWVVAVGGPDVDATAILRDLIPNPFQPPALVWDEGVLYEVGQDARDETPYLRRPCTWLAWNDGLVRRLAERIYSEGLWADAGIWAALADALEEGGCDNPDILLHCRGQQFADGRTWATEPCAPHVRGCWLIDLLTGRS